MVSYIFSASVEQRGDDPGRKARSIRVEADDKEKLHEALRQKLKDEGMGGVADVYWRAPRLMTLRDGVIIDDRREEPHALYIEIVHCCLKLERPARAAA